MLADVLAPPPVCPKCRRMAMFETPQWKARRNVPDVVSCDCGWRGMAHRILGLDQPDSRDQFFALLNMVDTLDYE